MTDYRQSAIDLRAQAVALQVDADGNRRPHEIIDWGHVSDLVRRAGELDRKAIAEAAG